MKIRLLLLCGFYQLQAVPHYYATAADSNFFTKVMYLIKTIQTNDAANFERILVFDLGFTPAQISQLRLQEKVQVYSLELKHPDLLRYFTTSSHGRKVRGWFAWKPVAIKQALDQVPYVLYLDSAMEVLRPLDFLFEHIVEQGYFLVGSGDAVEQSLPYRITQTVIDKIVKQFSEEYQDMLLSTDTRIISAGIQGLSRRYYDNYLMPVYNWVDDLAVFADDGTAKLGFGQGRHDQIIFSIYAALNGMQINRAGWQNLIVHGKRVPFHCHWNRQELRPYSTIKY